MEKQFWVYYEFPENFNDIYADLTNIWSKIVKSIISSKNTGYIQSIRPFLNRVSKSSKTISEEFLNLSSYQQKPRRTLLESVDSMYHPYQIQNHGTTL